MFLNKLFKITMGAKQSKKQINVIHVKLNSSCGNVDFTSSKFLIIYVGGNLSLFQEKNSISVRPGVSVALHLFRWETTHCLISNDSGYQFSWFRTGSRKMNFKPSLWHFSSFFFSPFSVPYCGRACEINSLWRLNSWQRKMFKAYLLHLSVNFRLTIIYLCELWRDVFI